MPEEFELKVHLAQDEETGRWYVAESDIPGLNLEADNPYELMKRLTLAVPELVELNSDEILAACIAKDKDKARHHVGDHQMKPRILPVFDSPLQPAYG